MNHGLLDKVLRIYTNYGADWQGFKLNGQMVNRPHYHRGSTKSQMKKHRQWQGRW